MADIVLCMCGHGHLCGARCWCGCAMYAPDTDDDYPIGEYPEVSL